MKNGGADKSHRKDGHEHELVGYLNSIDFSLVHAPEVLDNIYNEIIGEITALSKDPFASTSLEKLVDASNSAHLLRLLRALDGQAVHRKLGSRLVERVLRRLFDCKYVEQEEFGLGETVQFMDFGECLCCHNATFAVREALMLLGGKRIDKLAVTKYRQNSEDAEFGSRKLAEIKELLASKLPAFESNDQYNTLGVFLQITRSQSLLAGFLERDCSPESIGQRGFLYEMVPTIASKKNLALMYSGTKAFLMDLSMGERTSYFVQSFLRNSAYGEEVFDALELGEFDADSNVVLALLESLQGTQSHGKIGTLVRTVYRVDGSLFKAFLLERHGTLDTKYVRAVCNFMAFPQKHGFGVNEDFVRCFQREWARSKAGIALIAGFAEGASDMAMKTRFFNEHIDLFWDCDRWKDGKKFIRQVCALTTGHARKKAHEILHKFGK